MDRRQFTVGQYSFDLRLHTGPGPYLINLPDGREEKANAGEYLIYEGDKAIGHLPKNIVDALALDADELHTIERTRLEGDSREVKDQFEVETGPGEKFDGLRVIDVESGKPLEGKGLLEKKIQPVVSSADLRPDGEVKNEDDLETDAKVAEMAISHPTNIHNEAAGRAAREVAELARQRAANAPRVVEELREAKVRETAREDAKNLPRDKGKTSPEFVPETEDERKNRAKSLESFKDSQSTGAQETERKELNDEMAGFSDTAKSESPKSSTSMVAGMDKNSPLLTPGQKGTLKEQSGEGAPISGTNKVDQKFEDKREEREKQSGGDFLG